MNNAPFLQLLLFESAMEVETTGKLMKIKEGNTLLMSFKTLNRLPFSTLYQSIMARLSMNSTLLGMKMIIKRNA